MSASQTADRISFRRRSLIEEEWRTGAPPATILDKVNALPGPPVTMDQLVALAKELGNNILDAVDRPV